jgi:hypothetical protein
MPYTLTDFCNDLSTTLKSKGESGLPDVAQKLSQLLKNPAFVSETFAEDTPIGRRELWHDPATDVYMLAHVQEGGKVGKPHSHGASWAVYGNARAFTEMTEWRRTNPESEPNAVLQAASKYRLGTDLDVLPRYHFGKQDRILEKA